MTAIYSLSTLPHYSRNTHTSDFKLDKFELYTAAISSLVCRRNGVTTHMHCDTGGEAYFRRIGLAALWDNLTITIPDDLDGIDPLMFWAAGKLFALRETSAPLMMLDTDFIAWELPSTENADVIAAHREDLAPHIYPDISSFNMNEGYAFPNYDYHTLRTFPLNTAFLYIRDEAFKQRYVAKSLEFMKAAQRGGNTLTYMVYAEQRLLALMCESVKIRVGTLLEYGKPFHEQNKYTHTWGAKRVMRENPRELERFCEKCRVRIRNDFPEWEYIINCIEEGS